MATKTRNVIQIATVPANEDIHTTLIALCDDGTVWRLAMYDHQWVWKLMPAIPTT